MKALAPNVAFLLFAVPAAAQTVTATVSALTPLVAQATVGAQTGQAVVPAGPLGQGGYHSKNVVAGASSATTSVQWFAQVDDYEAKVELANEVTINSTVPASGHAGSHEFLIQFTASSPVMASLLITRTTLSTTGAPTPSVQLDFGNDGTIEDTNLVVFPSNALALGGQPLQLRVVMDSQLVGTGSSWTMVKIVVKPANQLLTSLAVAGCSGAPTNSDLTLQPTFTDRGLDLLVPMGAGPVVLVLGLTAQPVVLPSALSAPCLLIPSPQILLLAPPLKQHLPLPVAFRPVMFWVQGVLVTPNGLQTTAGFSVFAS